VDPVPDPRLLRKFDSAENRTRDLWIYSQELWPLDHSGGLYSNYIFYNIDYCSRIDVHCRRNYILVGYAFLILVMLPLVLILSASREAVRNVFMDILLSYSTLLCLSNWSYRVEFSENEDAHCTETTF
jgi:hypothetical protein